MSLHKSQISIPEFAEASGLSVRQVRRLIQAGRIPHYDYSPRVRRIPVSALLGLVKGGTK